MIEITRNEANEIDARIDNIRVKILPDGKTKAFARRAIRKNFNNGSTSHLECLVCELEGVRLYIKDGGIVLTTRELNH